MKQYSTARLKKKSLRLIKHAVLMIVSFLSAFPFYWMLVSATNRTEDVILAKMTPGTHLLANLNGLLSDGRLVLAFTNSLRNSLVTTLISLFISSLAGYGFVIFKSKGKDKVMSFLMLSMMIPAAATLIPLFRLFSRMGLVNTVIGFMLPTLATVFLIFMFRQAAQSFPYEIIQAARIDGLGELSIFTKIFMPIMSPTYAAAATVTFMGNWNAYLWPLVILQDSKEITMPLFLSGLTAGYVLDYGAIMLSVTIATLPTLVVFFALQRSFVAGIVGSVK